MIPDIDRKELERKAKQAEASTRKLFSRFKQKKPAALDERFESIHEEVFANTDCLKCANCCKTTSPIFKVRDIERLAKLFKLKPGGFIEKYLHMDSDEDYVLNEAPCPFLDSENYCLVYDHRPDACREYPHTNSRKMHRLLDLTIRNTFVCPAVYEIVEKLKMESEKLKM